MKNFYCPCIATLSSLLNKKKILHPFSNGWSITTQKLN